MTIHLGAVAAGTTIFVPFASYDANGASVTLSGLATSDIKIVKNGTSERGNVAGYALVDTDGTDVFSLTGLNMVSIDLADNTVASFFVAGSFYSVYVSTVTIATQTVGVLAATFYIRAAESTAGVPLVDVARINNVAATSVTAINANIGQTQPLNFTGTAGSALVKSDMVDVAGAAVSATTAQIGTNVVQVNTVATTPVTTIGANVGTTQPLNFTGTAASATVKSDVTDIAAAAVSTSTAQLGVNVVNAGATAWNSGAIKTTSFTAGAINAAAIADGAIDAATFATSAIDANALAADAVTEIVAGVLTTQLTEAYAADGVAPTLAQALFLIQQQLGEFTVSGTTLTVKKINGSSTAATFTLNDGTNPTAISRTT